MGGIMDLRNYTFSEPRGFATEDKFWAVGIWSVILSLAPVIVFYVLIVA